MNSEPVTYLRTGREVRAQGTILSRPSPGVSKVKPSREGWGSILVTDAEIKAGSVKAPVKPRDKSKEPTEPKPRKPKPAPQTRYERILSTIEQLTGEHASEALVMVKAGFLAEVAEELKEARNLFQPKTRL